MRALDGQPFRILRIDSDTEDVTAGNPERWGTAVPASLMHVVSLTYAAKSPKTLFPSGRVRITTDHPRMETIVVPWSAILRN